MNIIICIWFEKSKKRIRYIINLVFICFIFYWLIVCINYLILRYFWEMVYNTECMHSKIKNMTNDKYSVNIIYFRDMYNNHV